MSRSWRRGPPRAGGRRLHNEHGRGGARDRRRAAPVASGLRAAVVINAGNANACTGAHGEPMPRRPPARSRPCSAARPQEVLVSSTGVIGVPLPLDTLLGALPGAVAGAVARRRFGRGRERS